MVANVTFGNNFKGAEQYQSNKIVNGKNQSELIYMQNVMPEYEINAKNELVEKPLSIAKDMHDHAKSENTKVQKPVMHISFSFHKDENLTNEQMNKAIISALKEIGITEENHKFTIRRHFDKEHPHGHVLASRVGLDGKVHDNSFLANRLMVACDKVEKEQNLRPTKGRIFVFDPTKEKGYRKTSKQERERSNTPKLTKKEKIQAVQNQIKSEFNAEKKEGKNFEEIRERLADKGIQMNIATNKNGVYGLSFKKDEIAVKASKIGIKVKDVKQELAHKNLMSDQQRRFVEKEKINQEKMRFNEQERKMLTDIRKDIEQSDGPLRIDEIDDRIKEHIPEINPKKNVWQIVEEQRGTDYQGKLFEFAERKYEEKQSKNMELEKQKSPEKPSISPEVDKAKVEMTDAQKRFLQKEKELKQKREQEQNQRRGRRR